MTVLLISSTGRSAPSYVHDTWTEGDGLPSGTVSALLEDTTGFLWLGTSSRLARFDGYRYVDAQKLCPHLRSSSYFRAATNSDGKLWWGFMGGIASIAQEGCDLLSTSAGLTHPYVYAMSPNPEGGFWFGTGGTGVYRWDKNTLSRHPAYEVHPNLPGKVQALLGGPSGTLWVGTDSGLLRLDGAHADIVTKNDGLPSSTIQALAWGTDGTLLVGTSQGLVSMQGASKTLHIEVPHLDITSLLLDSKAQLWVGTAEGLYRRAPGENLWFTETRSRVGSLYEDRSHAVWVGTAEGLERYRNSSFVELFEATHFLAVEERRDGGLWALDNGGALHIVRDGNRRSVLPPGSISGEGMLDLVEDDDGSLWVGANELLHVGLDGSLQSFAVPSGEVSVLGPTQEGLRLIATTDAQGQSQLFWFRNGSFSPFLSDLRVRHVQRILLTQKGDIWVSTGGDGIFAVGSNGQITWFTDQDGLPSNFVRGLIEDRNGRVWAATSTGLAAIVRGKVHSFAGDPLLPDAGPVHLFLDGTEHLWVTADDGLYRIELSDLVKRIVEPRDSSRRPETHVRRFTRNDGLKSLEISWRPSGMILRSSGDLVLAHPRGLSSITVHQKGLPRDLPHILLEEVESDNQPLAVGKRPKLISGASLKVTLSVPELASPERVRLRYRLEGVDKDWVEANESRTISYAALPAGHHRLLVGARRFPEPFQKPIQLLEVTVLPRWHETAGARLLGLFALLSAFVAFHKLRLRHSRQREKQLADHVARKTNQLRSEVRERKRAETELLRLNAELDLRVKQRTQALMYAHEAVQLSEARFALAAKGAENAIWEWDVESNQLYCSQRWFEMLGLRKREMTPTEWLDRVHPEDRGEVEKLFTATDLSFRLEYRIRHAADRWLWILCRGARDLNDENQVVRAAGSQTDITKRKRFESELIRSANFDQLTGLPNRAYLLSHLRTLKHESETPFTFLFFDLDRFKSVNDSLGHISGDELLVQMGERLKLAFEPSGLVARLGGDEFAMVIVGAHDENAAKEVVEALHACMRAPFEVRSRLIYTTCSVGVCLSNQCNTVSDFLKNADLAMYRARQNGAGNSYFFSAQLAQEAALRLELESDLRPGIDADEFELFFQPIVSTRESALPRAEVLIRWRHPIRGLLSPGEFLDIVEETGLSGLLTERVLFKACMTSREWSHQGRDVQLSVNIPPGLFMTPNFTGQLERILTETGAEARLMSLELLESHSIEDVAQLNRQLQKTRRLGVKVYMDDFGTGYSSLSYLTELDIDGFKMDRRFLRDLLNEERAVKAYEAIMHLAQSLNMQVVAEGVERNSEFVILKRAGCEWFQGYLFAKPLSRSEFEHFSFHFDSQPASYSA